MIWLTVAAGVAAYPVVAGMVYRRLKPTVPPEPSACDGTGTNSFGSRCLGKSDIVFADVALRHRELYCPRCIAWCHWRVANSRIKDPMLTAWAWPVSWLPIVVKRLFDAGAGLRAVPAPPKDETADALEVRP